MATYINNSATGSDSVTLRDGRAVIIRSLDPSDHHLEKKLLESLSAESRRDRFLGGNCKVTDKLMELLTQNDHEIHEAYIALVETEHGQEAVGVSHYVCDDDQRACECAVTVSDDWQHNGLGTQLLQRLVDAAKNQGLGRIYSIDSAENRHSSRLAKHFGFDCHADPRDYTLVTYSLDLIPRKRMEQRVHANRW